MIIAISKFNIHPFIVMVVIAIAMGLVCGFDAVKVINTVKSGFGNILANIGIVILCGTIIGTILEKTGAALTMANSILGVVGKERSVLTMGAMGYVTGIPVFCDSGFVVLSPISRALAAQSNKSLAVMATALSGGLYTTHCLVPPTPGPIAMAGTLGADLGLTIIVGLILSVPRRPRRNTLREQDFEQGRHPGQLAVYDGRARRKIRKAPRRAPQLLADIPSDNPHRRRLRRLVPEPPARRGLRLQVPQLHRKPRRRAHARRIPRYDAHSEEREGKHAQMGHAGVSDSRR